MQFRTKARAVDLLGKGQIADLPTAITELWKNGYDAYADNLTAEIYLKGYKGLEKSWFVITDDGKGMSQHDIFDKWLVLGTDSKSRGNLEDSESEETLWKKPRIKAGEKGIGRLSVAFLGSPMLMLTKKRGFPLQIMFFDWRVLENYNLFLDDIEMPVESIESVAEFREIFDSLKVSFLLNLKETKNKYKIWEEGQLGLRDDIHRSVSSIEIPDFFETEFLSDIIGLTEDNGTKFIVFEPEQQILNLLNTSITDDDDATSSNSVRSSLVGFTNVFKNKEGRLPINTSFPIHKELGYDYDYLNSGGAFFSEKDYELADVIIDGKFDGTGNFEGTLIIYNEKVKHTYSSPRKRDHRSDYGSFNIKLGYSQGDPKETKLDEIQYKRISDKVDYYGGLYLYRDGFRILPYGRASADFLEFEERRSRRASTAYFSYRRMFGFIELTRTENSKLKDKSSREGLINNASYRAFVFDLIGLFKDLAQEYFSDRAKQSIFLDQKKKLKEQSEAIKLDKDREKAEKIAFTKSLREYPETFEKYKKEYQTLIKELNLKINSAGIIYSEIEDLLSRIHKLDITYKNLLPEVPKRYKPTDMQLDRLASYEEKLLDFNKTIKKNSEQLMAEVQSKLEVQELRKEYLKNFQQFNFELDKIINVNRKQLQEKLNSINKEFDSRSLAIINKLQVQKEQAILMIDSKDRAILEIDKIKTTFDSLRDRIFNEISPIVDHIKKLDFKIDEELLQGAYKAEYESIKEEWEKTRETAQLGIAVEIIDHEFNVLYSQINTAIDKLENVFRQSPNSYFGQLKKSFKSLEDKYELLSPLYRISGVVAKEIKCESIYKYLYRFFENKFTNENIRLIQTDSFKNHFITIKEPVIHTVFINVINNAVYWLRNSSKKEILLDYYPETDEILIQNSGQPIENHRIEKIFKLFYSNRPNGRGIGLYLSKQTLVENYFDIYATNDVRYNSLNGACFVIKPIR